MYYFAYGSNMNLDHMRRLCGWHFRVLGAARLDGFEFGIDPRGYNNIRESQGQCVLGVLFTLDQKALGALDEFEGYPEVFKRQTVIVKGPDGHDCEAWVYLQDPDQFGGKGEPEYMRRVIAGALENNLPQEWIKKLTSYTRTDG